MSDKKRLSLDKDAGSKHELAFEIVDRAIMHDTVLILQSLSEFFSAVTRKNKMPAKEAEAQVNDWLELFPVVSAKRETLLKAIGAVRSHNLFFWDAMFGQWQGKPISTYC